jgi:outer membrane protein assembly factor BamB
MRFSKCFLGVVFTLALSTAALQASVSRALSQQASDLPCYMETERGEVIDLTRLCMEQFTRTTLVEMENSGESRLLPDGTLTIAVSGGAILYPGRGEVRTTETRVFPDGTTIHADGTRVDPDGTVVAPVESFPTGTRVYPDGSQIWFNGTRVFPDGTTIYADGTRVSSDGTVFNPDGSTASPELPVMSPDEGEVVWNLTDSPQ